MRAPLAVLSVSLFLAAGASAQQPAPKATPAEAPPIVIFRVDLNPTGTVFAMNEPKLEGDKWVFRVLPERTLERVPKERVKKVSQWTRDFDKEVIWQVELNPTGRMLTYSEPVLKGGAYVVRSWKNETLVSVRTTDVKKVTRLTGVAAFKAEEEELGVRLIAGEIPDGAGGGGAQGGSSSAAAPAGAAPGTSGAQGNWTYQGKPGVTDAYAPPNATVAHPGDVPKAASTPAPR